MYITVEEFTKHVSHYLQMAKANDVYIEDTMHMTVWVLRSQRTPLLARLAGTRWEHLAITPTLLVPHRTSKSVSSASCV